MRVSLVRVGETWHVFADLMTAWKYYQEWQRYQDSEFLGDQGIISMEDGLALLEVSNG